MCYDYVVWIVGEPPVYMNPGRRLRNLRIKENTVNIQWMFEEYGQ
jgi:hypothetical protein